MRIAVARIDDNNIACETDFSDIKDKGEIAHFYMQLEMIQQELLQLWDVWGEDADRK